MAEPSTMAASTPVTTARVGPARTAYARLGPALLLCVAVGLTFVGTDYRLFQATMVAAYAIALLGLNILTGYNGQISIGHGAFFGLGAYAMAFLMDHLGVPYWLAVPAAGAVSFVCGYLFGLPALKLEGLYLALATFALALAMPQLLRYEHFERFTGGAAGISLTKPEAPFGLPLSADQWLYLVALAVLVLMFWLGRNLLQSGSGRAMQAIRDNPISAEALGVNTSRCKASTFAVSAAFTGVGGALAALAVQSVSPDTFDVFLSISLLVGIIVGGIGTISGALFGAVFIMFVPQFAEQVSKAAPWAVYGVVLIAFMFLMPQGVAGLIKRWCSRVKAE